MNSLIFFIFKISLKLPFMHPGKRSRIALSMSAGEIQLPNSPVTFLRVVGTVSDLRSVLINVHFSTRATSAGFVLASQLKIKI